MVASPPIFNLQIKQKIMIVQVKPIPETKWHGKKGIESFTRPKTIEALFDVETGELATGLSPEQAKEYGAKIGANLSPIFSTEEPHPFYGNKVGWVKLENHTLSFNTARPMDFIKVALCKRSKFVANSVTELNEGKWPEATHVIYDESEEVEIKATKIAKRRKCLAIDAQMDDDGRISMIQVITGKSFRGRSPNFITVEIEDIIENKPDEYLKYVALGKGAVSTLAAIKECILRGILTKQAGSVFYMDEMIGLDEIGAIEWFNDPINQKMKLSILDKLTK